MLFEMLDKCKNNDLIFATRYEKPDGGSDDDTIVTLIGNKIFSFLGNFLFLMQLLMRDFHGLQLLAVFLLLLQLFIT